MSQVDTQMADNEQVQATNTQTEPPAAQAAAEATPPVTAQAEQATKPEMTLEAALKELAEARKEAAKYRTTAKAVEKAKAEAEESALKEQGEYRKLYEKLQKDHEQAQAEIAKRDRADMQRKVAERVKLPGKLASRIQGETEAEMEADAKEMLGGLPAVIVGNDAAKGAAGNGTATIAGLSKEQAADWLRVDPKYIK